MKNKPVTKECVLVDIQTKVSSRNGGMYHKLIWAELDTMTRWETDAQDVYDNYENWREIIENRQWGVYENLAPSKRQTKRGVWVISADSEPKLVVKLDTQDLAIEVVLAEQHRQAQTQLNNMYDRVFVAE